MSRQAARTRAGQIRSALACVGVVGACLALPGIVLGSGGGAGYAPDLEIEKKARHHAKVGTAIHYEVLVKNAGAVAVAKGDVHVTDPAVSQAPLEYFRDVQGNSDDSLDPYEVWEYRLAGGAMVSLAETACKDVVNTAEVEPVPDERDTYDNRSTVTTHTHCDDDVELTKTSDKEVYRPGETVYYTITVINKSDIALPLANVHVSDPMLADLAPQAPVPAAIPVGGSLNYLGTKLVTSADCGRLKNRAEVVVDQELFYTDSEVPAHLIVPDPTSNRGMGSDEREHADHKVHVRCQEDLQIAKTADKQTYLPGETITYSVTVTNSGDFPIAVNRIHVSDPLLADLSLTGTAPEKLGVGASLVYRGTRAVTTADCGPLVNVASVSLDPDKPKPSKPHYTKKPSSTKKPYVTKKPGTDRVKPKQVVKRRTHHRDRPPKQTDTATVTVTVLCPINLTVAKTADKATYVPGETITYTVTVTNTGTLPISTAQIQIADPTLPNLAPVALLPVDLAPNATLTYRGTRVVGVENCGNVTNVVTIATPNDANPADNTATVTVAVAGGACTPTVVGVPSTPPGVTPPPPTTTLLVDKQSAATSRGKRPVAFRIFVTNTGTETAKDVVVTDRIPEGFALVRLPKGATLKAGVVRWSVGDLAPGATKSVGVWMRPVRNQARRICNTGEAGGANTPVTQDTQCVRILRVAGVTNTPVTG